MRTALIVGASAATAAAAGVAGFKLYKDTYGAPVDEQVAQVLKGNERLFSSKELALIKDLLARGQAHLFAAWPPPGTQDSLKRRLISQLMSLNATYHGGLCAYVDNARKLLQDSKESRNPFDGYTPSVPHGEKLDFATPEYLALEQEGLAQAASTAFVLVAGGLGERLGYSGIKVALPCESASGWSFLELYARFIKALQVASGASKKLPFAIMTSDDTHARTLHHLEAHRYFGLDKGQVHLIKQEKVACLIDNDAALALDPADSYALQTKPHGHGDVHALLHSSGLAKKWHSHGFKWVAFFQDTNAQVFRALTAALGVSARHDYDMNSLAVPRKAKEAIGAIACLKHTDGSTLTINVEYNQLDPLLRGTVSPQGDVNDETGWSPYPGNINQLIIKLDSYVQQLQRTGGIISEFVNPKYKDASKTAFKSSTRLECMMQDYPKALPSDAKVGFTTVNQVWASYSPVKNNAADAQAKAKEGGPTHSATTGEVDLYRVNCYILEQLAGARLPPPEPATFNGISVNLTPRVVLAPEWAPTLESVQSKVSKDSIRLSEGAVLLIDGPNIKVEGPLEVQGALVIRAVAGANVRVGALNVSNAGWTWQPLKEGEEAKEEEKIRGFRVLKTETAEYFFDKAGDYTVGLLPQAERTPLAPPSTPAEPLTPMMSMQPLGSTSSPAKSSLGQSAAPAAAAPSPPAAPAAAAPSAPAAPAAAAPPAPLARVAAPAPVATSGTPAAPGTPTAAEEAGPLAPAPTPSAPAAPAAEAAPVRAPATPTATLSAAAAVFTPSSAVAVAPTTVTPPASEADPAGGEEEEEEGEDDPTVTPPGGSAAGAGSSSAAKKKKKKSSKRK